jgi:Mor family transcriptional regulator
MAKIRTEEVKKLLEEGKRVTEIAKEYKITRQAIYCHINKFKEKEIKKEEL